MDDSVGGSPRAGAPAAGASSSLQTAIREDHEQTCALLTHFREAWLAGDVETARKRFRIFEVGVLRHLDWEERMLIAPFREKLPVLHDLDMLRGDVEGHRDLRAILIRISKLLPERSRGNTDTDRRILELIEKLEALLVSHRLFVEDQLCTALDEVLTPCAQDDLARSLAEGPAAKPD